MRRQFCYAITIVSIACAAASPATACTTFCIDRPEGPVFGKNYDWNADDGMLFVNKRGVSKPAMTQPDPLRWISKYGSVTFNQYGAGMPCGGINEAGLVIELMWLDETQYPPPDSRPQLPELQWIQYHLDCSATVEEVVAGDADVRIASNSNARLHFLVADRSGACASIEFLGGEMVAHTGVDMPVRALTNDTYIRSATYLEKYRESGGREAMAASRGSLARFVRAAQGAATFDGRINGDPVDYAFEILAAVAQGDHTKWSIVYDLAAMRVYFRTLVRPQVRYVDLGRFDFACDSPVRILDINGDYEGDVSRRFEPYTHQANRALVERAFRKTQFLADTPAETLDRVASYPQRTTCPR